MGLNKSKGNMYPWITDTWNTVKGACYHDCSYCYMKHWGPLNPVRFDEKELKTDLGKDKFIFVGSSCDMFAKDIPIEWIHKTINYCEEFDNKYLLQTKNPFRLFGSWITLKKIEASYCVTIETNRYYPDIMALSPQPIERVNSFMDWDIGDKYITIEPVMDFDLTSFMEMIKICEPKQVNIGANTSKIKLPEPSKEKILALISELEKFTKVKQKSNLARLLK